MQEATEISPLHSKKNIPVYATLEEILSEEDFQNGDAFLIDGQIDGFMDSGQALPLSEVKLVGQVDESDATSPTMEFIASLRSQQGGSLTRELIHPRTDKTKIRIVWTPSLESLKARATEDGSPQNLYYVINNLAQYVIQTAGGTSKPQDTEAFVDRLFSLLDEPTNQSNINKFKDIAGRRLTLLTNEVSLNESLEIKVALVRKYLKSIQPNIDAIIGQPPVKAYPIQVFDSNLYKPATDDSPEQKGGLRSADLAEAVVRLNQSLTTCEEIITGIKTYNPSLIEKITNKLKEL